MKKSIAIEESLLVESEDFDIDAERTRLHFYVSDFVKKERPTPKPVDPFLAVCATGAKAKLFVIERWDEPAFRS